ncbi:MAG TPA: SdrD B-like domain-containing protein, partial [Anaerolineales bacterium]|nr:SdrD B-like domain-containing protein [Anaerolineales bacterium]
MKQSFYKYPATPKNIFRSTLIGIIFLMSAIRFSPDTRTEAQTSGIQGLVFRDFNANGMFESKAGSYQEVGVSGIVVTAYDDAGNSVATVNSDANGAYQLTVPAGNYRVAFSGYGNGDFSGVQGEDTGSSIQFVTAPAEAINFAINYPDHYCQANPEICSPVYVNGDPLQTGSASSSTSFVSFRYDGTDIPQAPDVDAKGSQTGPLWGIAFQTNTRILYGATFIRRHVGIGPLGEGGIYRLTYNFANPDAAPTVSTWLDAKTLGIDTGLMGTGATPAERNLSRGLNPTKSLATADTIRDLQAYDGVGKVGFGGLDISEDNDTLWVVNLNQRTLNSITIDSDNNPDTIPTSADVSIFNIPNPSCSNGEARPFAVKAYRGKIYVGVVCDASISQNAQDLMAVVLEFDGNSFSTIFSMPLNYARQNGPDYLKGSCTEPTNWRPWTTSIVEPCVILGYYIYPQPILSAIEFDIDGSLMLGFMDRGSQQFGYKNTPPKALSFATYEYYGNSTGDTLRVCRVNNAYVLEGQSGCPQHLDADYPYNTNAGGNSGIPEFYHEDVLRSHLETSLGGVAFFAGSGEVVTTAINPYNTIANSAGVNWFSNQTGLSRPTGYVVYEGGNDQTGNFSKAGGLGDVDILCENAPVEIGNRVWLDVDKDGLQDASEPPIAGVRVQLVQAGVVIATVVTNDNGNYIFSSATGTDSDSFHYGLNLKRGESYEVRIPIDSQSTIGKPLYQTQLTTANADQITNNIEAQDRIDSDGILAGTSAGVQVQIGNAGQNNHTYDFGFITEELTATPTVTATVTPVITVVETSTATPTSPVPSTQTATPTVTATVTPVITVVETSTATPTSPVPS